MIKKSGFTLAEVLITLGIIGVVAAMTIPTLINSTNQAEFKSGIKKAVSSLNQAIMMNVAVDSTDFSGLSAGVTAGSATVYNMFTNRMKIASTTSAALTVPFTTAANANYTLYLNDGMVMTFPVAAANCAVPVASGASDCRILIDVNGGKSPNKIETDTTKPIKDQFVFDFYNQQVMPHDKMAKFALYD